VRHRGNNGRAALRVDKALQAEPGGRASILMEVEMIKRIGLATLALAGVMAFAAPQKANAAVRFGIGFGAPVYTYPVYPYPYYGYPGPVYAYPGYMGPGFGIGFGLGGGWGGHWGGHGFHGRR